MFALSMKDYLTISLVSTETVKRLITCIASLIGYDIIILEGEKMIHKGTQELYTERLQLRKFTSDDAQEMFDNWTNDPDVTKYLSWEPHGKVEITQAVVNDWVNSYSNLNCYNWAIVFNNKLIGSISLLNPNDELSEAEAGYCMSKNYWGMGIMVEALSVVLKYAFDDVGFKRIHAKHNVDNPNSGKVMKKCSMKYLKTENKPLALKQDKIVMCDCYEILNPNFVSI